MSSINSRTRKPNSVQVYSMSFDQVCIFIYILFGFWSLNLFFRCLQSWFKCRCLRSWCRIIQSICGFVWPHHPGISWLWTQGHSTQCWSWWRTHRWTSPTRSWREIHHFHSVCLPSHSTSQNLTLTLLFQNPMWSFTWWLSLQSTPHCGWLRRHGRQS